MREWFQHDLAGVDNLFRWCQRDLRFLGALQNEMQECLSWRLGAHPYPDALLEAARRAIADGLIAVAAELPTDWVLRFDEMHPTQWNPHQLVVFPTLQMAERCVVAALQTSEGQAAIAGALSHLAGRTHRGSEASAGNGSLVARVMELLASQVLAVTPRDQARRVWCLVWMENQAPALIKPRAPPPVPQTAPPPPAQQFTAPASTLPDAPQDLSSQALALLEAAQDGVPFCEECIRARAAQPAYA